MRPEILFPLFRPTTALKGIGGRTAAHLARLDINRMADLLWHLPVGVVDRRLSPPIMDAPHGAIVTLTVEVLNHLPAPPRGRRPYKVICRDHSGEMDLIFFHPNRDYIQEILPEGGTRLVSGRVERFQGRLQMSHPDYVLAPEARDRLPVIEPVYGLTAGLAGKALQRAISQALSELRDLPEWIDPTVMAREGWPTWRDALATAHQPEGPEAVMPTTPARARLAYDELLANQLALALVRERLRRRKGRSTVGDGRLTAALRDILPFALTEAQVRSIAEVDADLAAPTTMLRLLQGDVGSGKTMVALHALLTAVEAGGQGALLAPTEILARQHLATIEPLADRLGVSVGILTGRDKGRARETLLKSVAAGEIAILIGTHALFENDVAFRDLRLAVVDEQHRFGVHQRLKLADKAAGGTDMLVMTATPIPRTLALTAYGDMDVSRLDEKPAGRKPVDTRTIPAERLDEVVAGIGRAIAGGARVYWVCPLVEESELTDLSAAAARHETLVKRFGERVGLVHGRMPGPEKDRVMNAFAAGELDVLVATTVIEVGVNVPEATVMVIEHAERFGLAQLHQLRGRVGRGAAQSRCILLYAQPLGETAKARLAIMRETEDGFRIAEEDLKLRGAGEVLGTRQSGLPQFRLADLAHHQDLLAMARDDARLIVERDPRLQSPRGEALRVLLYLFERDAAIRYLHSG